MIYNPYDFYHRLLQLISDNMKDDFKHAVEDIRLPKPFKINVIEQGNFGSIIGDDSLYSTILNIQDKDTSFYYFELIIKNGFDFFHNKNHIAYFQKYILPFQLEKHWILLVDNYYDFIFNNNTKDKSLLSLLLINNSSNNISTQVCEKFVNIMTDSLIYQQLNPAIILNDCFKDILKNDAKINIDYIILFRNLCKNKSIIPYLKNQAEHLFIAFFRADKKDKDAFFNLFSDDIYHFKNQGYNLCLYIYKHYLTVIHFISAFRTEIKDDDLLLEQRFAFLDYVIDNPKMRPFLFEEQSKVEDCVFYPVEPIFYSYESINIDLNYRPFQINYDFEYQDNRGYTILHHLLANKDRDENTLKFIEKALCENLIDIYNVKNEQGYNLYDLFPEHKKYEWLALIEQSQINFIVDKKDDSSETHTTKKRL